MRSDHKMKFSPRTRNAERRNWEKGHLEIRKKYVEYNLVYKGIKETLVFEVSLCSLALLKARMSYYKDRFMFSRQTR